MSSTTKQANTVETLAANLPAKDAAANDYTAKPPAKKTKGEKLFDTALYGGISYGLGFIASVIGGHFFLKGSGRQFYNSTEKSLEKSIETIAPNYAKRLAHESMRILALGAGGHLVMIPIKMLEDRKKRIVYWINTKFFPSGYGDHAPAKPLAELRDDELPTLVETPSEMSWGKTAARRMGIFFGIPLALAPFAKINSAVESKVQQGLTKSLAVAAESTQSKTLAKLKDSKLAQEYIEMGAADLYLSAIAAFLVRMTNGAHGFLKSKKNKDDKTEITPASDAMPAEQTAQGKATLPPATPIALNPERHGVSYREALQQQKISAEQYVGLV